MFGNRKRKDSLGGMSPSEIIRLEGQRRQQKLKQDITRYTLNMATYENTMNRKLRTAVNKALAAKASGSETELRNAYIDIRMALKFLGIARGMSSVMTRLESNMEFSQIAEEMVRALTASGELTKANPHIDMTRLDQLYNSAVDPINRIAEQMAQFGDLSVVQPMGGYDISDEEVEKVIRQVIANPKASIEPPIVPNPPITQSVTPATGQPAAKPQTNRVEDMISELNELAKRLQ